MEKLTLKDRLELRRIAKYRDGADRRDEEDKKEGEKDVYQQTHQPIQ